MKNKFPLKKVGLLLTMLMVFIIKFNSYSQSYLPLTGGTLTGNLNMSSGTQIQSPYYTFAGGGGIAPPSTSNYSAIFTNSVSGTLDMISPYHGWRFIPQNGSTYGSPVFSIDNNGYTNVYGGLFVQYPYEASGLAYGSQIRAITQNASTTSVTALDVRISTLASSTMTLATLLNLTGITKGSGSTVTSAYGINMPLTTAGSGNNFDIAIGASTATGNYSIYDNSSYNNYFKGNMGIGTSSPLSLLSVGSSSQFQVNSSGAIVAATGITTTGQIQANTTAGGAGLKLWDQSNGAYTYLIAPVNPGYIKQIIIDQPNERILLQHGNADNGYGGGISRANGITDIFNNFTQFGGVTLSTLGVKRLTVSNSGNVGIGTTDNSNWTLASSPYILAVNGSEVATSVTVKLNANWPDYVFKPGYQLPTLSEVKTYIGKNQHLPEMPSAEQLEKDGLNLGEMNKLLVKKVEELTLYLIEKDGKEKEQDERLKKLEEMVEKLSKK